MERLKKHWFKAPRTIRRPIVLMIGTIILLAAGAIGWLPGPGGIPLFLIGITILATEFHWATRIRNFVLAVVFRGGRWFRAHKFEGTALIFLALSVWIWATNYFFF